MAHWKIWHYVTRTPLILLLSGIYLFIHHQNSLKQQPLHRIDKEVGAISSLVNPVIAKVVEAVAPAKPVNILLLGFMRGGTTLLEQVFDHDPDAMAWYEPLGPFYGHFYGIPKYRVPSFVTNAATRFNPKMNGLNLRDVGEWEMQQIITFFRSLFACDVDALPRTVLSNTFIFKTSVLSEYSDCYRKNAKNMSLYTLGDPKQTLWEAHCIDYSNMTQLCDGTGHSKPWTSVENAITYKCPQYLSAARTAYTISDDPPADHLELADIVLHEHGLNMSSAHSKAFYEYEQCMAVIETIVSNCSDLTEPEKVCQSKRKRAAKILRLRMKFFAPILRALPNLYVIHYFRDPRAIAYSRLKLTGQSTINMKSWLLQVRVLCDEIVSDLEAADAFKVEFPGTILTLTYEDLVLDLKNSLTNMYGHWKEKYPESTYKWLLSTMNASENNTESFSVVRANASELVDNWRRKIDSGYVGVANEYGPCLTVYDRLGYQP